MYKQIKDNKGSKFLIETDNFINIPYRYIWTYHYYEYVSSGIPYEIPFPNIKYLIFDGEEENSYDCDLRRIKFDTLNKFWHIDLYPEITDKSIFLVPKDYFLKNFIEKSFDLLTLYLE